MNPNKSITVNPQMIKMWATRDKCWQCKYKFEKPVILPVEKITPGKFQPNINPTVLLHVQETHGIPADTTYEWIVGSVYGMELGDFGIKGFQHE